MLDDNKHKSNPIMKKRTNSREYVLQFIYFLHSAQDKNWVDQIDFFEQNLTPDQLRINRDFVNFLISGIIEKEAELTKLYSVYLKKTPSKINKIILLIGTYELKYTDESHKVIINEALNLAHKFSSKDAFSFINGILDKIANDRV